MKEFFKVDANHPVAMRILKTNLTENEKNDLVNELIEAGYEKEDIEVDITKTIFQVGDEIYISESDYKNLPETEDVYLSGKLKAEIIKKGNAKKSLRYIFGENPNFPLKGILQKKRLSHDSGQLIVKWENPVGVEWSETNVYFLEDMGFEFEHPTFEKIPLIGCSDTLLGDHDLVIKYMMIQNKWTEKEVDKYLKPVYNAMKKAEIVFYRP